MVILLLTYYKYKWRKRREIYSYFKVYMSSKDVFTALDRYDFLHIP